MTRFFTAILLIVFSGILSAADADSVFVNGFGENSKRLTSDESITSWLGSELKEQLGLGPADELSLSEQSSTVNNFNIRSLQQTHQGIPIVGYESRLILDQQGNQVSLVGQHQSFDGDAPTEAVVDSEQALLATGFVESSYISDAPVYLVADGELRLSWEVDGNTQAANSPIAEKLFIDAVSGEVIARYPLVYSALTREVGDMELACRDAGISFPVDPETAFEVELMVEEEYYHRSEGEASEGAAHVDELYNTLGDAYEFIESVLGMDSLDNAGLRLKAIAGVHYYEGDGWNQCVGNSFNAMWSGQWNELYIPETAIPFIEVVAHELSHGIISNGSELAYQFDSGAMDEAISDALGVSFRAWREAGGRQGSSPSSVSTFPGLWELRSDTGPLRSMSNPKSVWEGYPDHYSEFYNLPIEDDQGGVHTNSSIINQAFYILVEGGRHPRLGTGPNVQGIGITNAAAIFGLAGSQLLTPFADFEAGRNAFALAAEILYGEYSDIWVAVHEAMDAVGIPGTWQRSAPVIPPVITPDPVVPDPITPEPTNPDPVIPDTSLPDPVIPDPIIPDTTTSTPEEPVPVVETANNNALYIGLGIAFLALALFGLSRLRPEYSTTAPEYRPAAATPMPSAEPEARLSPQQISVNRSRIFGRLVGSGTSGSIELDDNLLSSKEGLVIGRSSNLNHVVLNDSRVSRRHCRLRKEGQIVLLEDLSSTHGTSVNANKIQPFSKTVVNQGDRIDIAGIQFTCDLSG